MSAKNKIFAFFLACLLATLTSSCTSGVKKTGKIPVQDFFRNPEQSGFQLSPTGEHISFLKPFKNRMNLFVLRMGANDTTRITGFDDRDIRFYIWANDSTILFGKDKKGDENFKLFSVRLDGTNLMQLSDDGPFTVQIIDELRDNPDEIIISNNARNNQVFDLFRLNISTGEKIMIAENPGNISDWIVDHNGKLRLAVSTDGVNTGILYRETEQDEFRLMTATNFKEMLYPVAFTFDNKYTYAVSNKNRDKAALVIYDVINDKELDVVFEHYEVDISSVILSKKKQKLAAVSFVTWKMEYEFFDEEKEDIYRSIKSKLPNKELEIRSFSRDESKVLVATQCDRCLGAYYYYSVADDLLVELGQIGPWLNDADLSPMKPISYRARDGLKIHGYLTFPKQKDHKNLPVVVFPHGGPWTRDRWGFNNTVQFFANRGYVVLQMNYRGSFGYGRTFREAGHKEWGGKIQDDIADGVNWLIKQEIADPNKITIFGLSFGGYSALQSLILYPDLYACGINMGGYNNLIHLLKEMPSFWKPFEEMLYEMAGNPVTDKKMLKKQSPYFNYEKIVAPVFIAQGSNDKLVDARSTELMVKKMQKKGLAVEFMLIENEGHIFQNEENRIEFYKRVEKFLDLHIHGKIVN